MLPETKICHYCGCEFERPTHTATGRRYLRQPMQWRRQRFCSSDCVRSYRLEGPFREWLPSDLRALEPERSNRR